jgi:phospho-N-acetylmuramoyl-pentapeptide-transferase
MNFDIYTAIYAILIAFIVNAAICPLIIPILHRIKCGQPIRGEGPESHRKKEGTPTMGGVMILISFLAGVIFFLKGNTDAVVVLLITLGYGIIGFIDDFLKVVKKQNLGLRAWQKIVFQLIVTIIFFLYIKNCTDIGTDIYIPFAKGYTIDLGWLYAPFLFFVMVGTVNAVNLTDGLDGLASGVTVLVMLYFLFVVIALDKGLIPVCGAAVGALLGFLLFNSHPAKVFMGDTGSLALGGLVASTAVLTKMPVMLVIVGLVYVCESLSVILQVGYFKLTHGKRIFKMAPIHHHFELCGFAGVKVVQVFWIVTAIMCLIGFIASKGII